MLGSIRQLRLFVFFVLSTIPLAVFAQVTTDHIVVTPSCLLKNTVLNYQALSTSTNLQLIKVNDDGIRELIAEKDAHHAERCGGFIDVTNAWNKSQVKTLPTFNAKSFLSRYENTALKSLRFKANNNIQYKAQVNQLFNQINAEDIWADLTTLSTTYKNRDAFFNDGIDAQKWLMSQVNSMVKNNNRTDVSISTVKTGTLYNQQSIVVKIGNSTEPGIVIGAHMDAAVSIFSDRPGADDDGSGTVTVLEVARVLLASNIKFKKPIYLIWYAAEEEGLVGSQNVVAQFKDNKIPVEAVMHLDMVGYADKNDPTLWLLNDNVNTDLNTYLKKLINEYIKKPVKETACGYGCSDHVSWTKAGYPASAPFEASFETMNPDYHNSTDTIDKLSLSHMTDYAKLAVAFAVEVTEPIA